MLMKILASSIQIKLSSGFIWLCASVSFIAGEVNETVCKNMFSCNSENNMKNKNPDIVWIKRYE